MHYKGKGLSLLAVLLFLAAGMKSAAAAGESQYRTVGGYLVVNGKVADISSGMLTVNGNQYPISKFVCAFQDGRRISFKIILDLGKIHNADLYLLGGKVEKIVVLQII